SVDVVESAPHISERIVIEVPDADLCPRYVARMVEGVTIGPSPLKVRVRLHRAGLRPISNVVDATNLVLLECGQPLHAFDYRFLEKNKIVVRRSDPDETFVTLDGQERKLPPNALTIRDGVRAVALAGIMGGLNSEIKDDTTSVLIESACFEPFGIRRTSKSLGLSTEASFRFERGVDPEGSVWAARRVAQLIAELAGGRVLQGMIDVYPSPIVRPAVKVRMDRINRFLGTTMRNTDMLSYFERLGVKVDDADAQTATVTPPPWRWDLEREEDMAEEAARIHGFQNVPTSMPSYGSAPDNTREEYNRTSKVSDIMAASGFTEIITMSFVSREAAGRFPMRADPLPPLELLNPLTEDQAVMRTSLLPGLMSMMKRNNSFRLHDLRLYEVGKAFVSVPGLELPREEFRLAGLACGARYPDTWHFHRGEVDTEGKIDQLREVDFFDVKGPLETLFEAFGSPEPSYVRTTLDFLHPGKAADILLAGERIGFVGELSPIMVRELDLFRKPYVFEILLEPLFLRSRKDGRFSPIPRYPYIERDLSIIVEDKVSGDEIKRLISRFRRDIITSVVLFDLYRGESIPAGYRSMAFRIRYQSDERTLTDEEVQVVHDRLVQGLVEEFGAVMRA
ncbi:MAG: phenylalanine--tRNA ligase subunit beta, partial [Pseudomonadota bacterium]